MNPIAWLIEAALGLGGIVKRIAAAIPPKVWLAIGITLAALLLWHVHGVKERAAFNAAFNQGYTAAAAKFNAAQAKADTAARAHVATVVVKQGAIDTESSNALLETNDDIDARAAGIRLRHDQAAGARRSASEGGHPSATGEAPPGPCEATASDGLSWSVALPLMTQAAKDLAQLNAVLDWEAKQEALDAAEPVE